MLMKMSVILPTHRKKCRAAGFIYLYLDRGCDVRAQYTCIPKTVLFKSFNKTFVSEKKKKSLLFLGRVIEARESVDLVVVGS